MTNPRQELYIPMLKRTANEINQHESEYAKLLSNDFNRCLCGLVQLDVIRLQTESSEITTRCVVLCICQY